VINSIQIKNFKSVVDLTFEVGTFNVLIGENGCGKSNILEAIGFGAAASADKLDQEFLGSRGIRLTKPEFMFSAFEPLSENQSIDLVFKIEGRTTSNLKFEIAVETLNSKKWKNSFKEAVIGQASDIFVNTLFDIEDEEKKGIVTADDKAILKTKFQVVIDLFIKNKTEDQAIDFFKGYFTEKLNHEFSDQSVSNYLTYSPDQDSLRKFEETNQIYPLGIKGQGLFQYLKELSANPDNKELFSEIKDILYLLDWYDDFELPEGLMSNEYALNIKDKYLHETLRAFDQKSTNEGFLFLLFYAVLFTSKETPAFFAIDNIDMSFNPKLCSALIKKLTALAVKKGKQVIVTTHNPAILDGLDLSDDAQRLFVVRRNGDGHTKARRIEYKSDRKMKLSELWTNGIIGGLPDNF